MTVHEIRGTFVDEVIAFERPTRLMGAGKLTATPEGLRIEALRRAGWTAPTLGCLAPLLLVALLVGLATAVGLKAYGVGRIGGAAIFGSIIGGWILGHLIAPRRAIDVVVPWDEIASVSAGGRKVYFRIAKGDLRGKTTFAADSADAFAEVTRRMKARRWDA